MLFAGIEAVSEMEMLSAFAALSAYERLLQRPALSAYGKRRVSEKGSIGESHL